MMDKETVSNKLRKIKELAQRGVGGEKESALALYEKLKQKYEISEDEIFDEKSFHLQKELTEKLLQKHRLKKTKNNHLWREQKKWDSQRDLFRKKQISLVS